MPIDLALLRALENSSGLEVSMCTRFLLTLPQEGVLQKAKKTFHCFEEKLYRRLMMLVLLIIF